MKGDRFPARPLRGREPERMVLAAKTLQEKALVIILWRAGLRNAEARDLLASDFEERPEGALRVHVVNGKGGKTRWAPLDPKAAGFVRPLIESRGGTGLLFRTRRGNRLHTSQIRRYVKRIAQAAGIRRRVHPHSLRHTFAKELHNENFSVQEIRRLLGHASIATTQVYLESIGCVEAVEKAERRKSW